jgi:hypothetical protein
LIIFPFAFTYMAPQLDMFDTGTPSPRIETTLEKEVPTQSGVEIQAHAYFTLFKVELDKLRKQGVSSGCPHYWRSRYHDWINHCNGDSKEVWEEKKQKELAWPDVWRLYRDELAQIYLL